MKQLIPIFIMTLLLLSNCKEGGLLPAKKRKLYGIWEMVSYEINNEEVIHTKKFVNLGMNLGKGNYSDPTVFSHRNLTSSEIQLSGIPDYSYYNEKIFKEIETAYLKFAAQLSFDSVTPIPLSALNGDNVTRASDNADWYRGPHLLEYLEDLDVDSADLGLLLNNFGAEALSVAAVPEPSALALLLMAALGVMYRRKT